MADAEVKQEPVATPGERSAGAFGPIFLFGIVVGAFLILLGFGSLYGALIDFTISALLLCSGLALIFGAFGSTATVRFKGIVITGVAAIALTILYTLVQLISDNYVVVKIGGDVTFDGNQMARIEAFADSSFHGRELRDNYEFIIRRSSLTRKNIRVEIEFPEEETGADHPEPQYVFECVDRDVIANRFGSGAPLEWRFDRQGYILRDMDGRIIAERGRCGASPVEARAWPSFRLFGSALAQSDVTVEALIKELEASSSMVRREARTALSQLGARIVPEVAPLLLDESISYRLRLGMIVSLTEMMRENKKLREEISEQLSDDTLDVLVKASGDPDRTIRIYASEFLFDLGDPRAISFAQDYFGDASENGKYNLLIVVQGAYPHLDDGQRTKVDAWLGEIRSEVGPKTQALIDTIRRG